MDKKAWSGFEAVSVNMVEQCLEMRKLKEVVDMLKKENKELEKQVNRLVAKRNVIKEEAQSKSVPPHHPMPEEDRSHGTGTVQVHA